MAQSNRSLTINTLHSTVLTSTKPNLRTQAHAISQTRQPRTPRSSPRGPPRSQRCPSRPQECLRAPPRARPPATPAPGPPLLARAHTTHKRKDSTSQSSAASMATVASRTPLPFRNLPGREPPSREKWVRPAGQRGVASSQGAGPRVARPPLLMQGARNCPARFRVLRASLPGFRESKDVSSGRGLKDQVYPVLRPDKLQDAPLNLNFR